MLAQTRSLSFSIVLALATVSLLTAAFALSLQAQSPVLPGTTLTCEDGIQPSGAPYRICLPAAGWNGDLVLFAHAYVDPAAPVSIPEEQLTIGGVSIADVVTVQGYAFAASGFRRNGLAILEGVADLAELVDVFVAKHGQPDRVILTGASEGGAIVVLAVERRPDLFDGGLALCGPYGDFQRQINYFTDFRVVFDYFFPGVIEGTPITITGHLTTAWETSYYSETVKPLLINPTYEITVNQIISVTGVAVDATGFPTGTEPTFDRLLWYNIISTNDAKQQLGGNPFANLERVYAGSLNDGLLNAGVFRTAADLSAVHAISNLYASSGVLRVPLITLHTTGDEITPYWHAVAYEQKVDAAGSAPWYEHRKVERFGHCNFTLLEVQAAFAAIVERANVRTYYLPFISADAAPGVDR